MTLANSIKNMVHKKNWSILFILALFFTSSVLVNLCEGENTGPLKHRNLTELPSFPPLGNRAEFYCRWTELICYVSSSTKQGCEQLHSAYIVLQEHIPE